MEINLLFMKKVIILIATVVSLSFMSFTSMLNEDSSDQVITLTQDIITEDGDFIPVGSDVIICPDDGVKCTGEFYPVEGGTIKYNSFKKEGEKDIKVVI